MKTKLIVLFSAILMLLPTATFAQSNQDQLLYGTWRHDDPDNMGYLFFLGFYPNGTFYEPMYEGVARGRFVISGNKLTLQGTMEYVESENFTEVYTYTVGPETLTISGRYGTSTLRRMSFYAPPPDNCPGTLRHQLFMGAFGQVTFTDGTATRLRSGPGTDYKVLQSMPEGTPFVVIDGPVCNGNAAWWKLSTLADDVVGWSTEGVGYYFIEPHPGMGDIINNPPPIDTETVMRASGVHEYQPGQYPEIRGLSTAITNLPEIGKQLVNIKTLVLFVKEAKEASNIDLVCVTLTASNTLGGPEIRQGDLLCMLYDTTKLLVVSEPIAGSAFIMAEIAANPEVYIDPWLDNVNRFTDSMPLTRAYCYFSKTDCSAIFGR